MRRNWQWFVGVVAIIGVAACFAGINPDYNPNWQVGDEWTVKVTCQTPCNRKNIDPSQYPTNAVFPYLWLEDYTNEVAYYVYRVETNTNATVTISMTPTNSPPAANRWQLEFETNELTMQKTTKWWCTRPGFEDVTRNGYGQDTWPAEGMGGAAAVIDFPKIPTDSTSSEREIPVQGFRGYFIKQENSFTSSNVTMVLIRTNALDGLDHKVTITWPKYEKWWRYAKEEYGTNVTLSAERIDP